MNEKKEPFDAEFIARIKKFNRPWNEMVIEEIREQYLCTDPLGKSICPLEKCGDYQSCLGKPFIQAIRVLAFAPTIRQALVDFIEWGAMTSSDLNLHRGRFRALLETLPDEKED